MNTHELAWAAGFFDGEGHVGYSRRKRRDLSLTISQIDRRVLDRFRAAVGGLGRVIGPLERTRPNERPTFYFQTSRYDHVQAIIAMIWAWLSPVKREQATEELGAVKSFSIARSLRLAKNWTTCRRGHPRTPENVKIVMFKGYETRRCLVCLRERPITPEMREHRRLYERSPKRRAYQRLWRQRKLAEALIIAT